jgi:hypothetical protein
MFLLNGLVALLALYWPFPLLQVAVHTGCMHHIPAQRSLVAPRALLDAIVIFILVMAVLAPDVVVFMNPVRHHDRADIIVGLYHTGLRIGICYEGIHVGYLYDIVMIGIDSGCKITATEQDQRAGDEDRSCQLPPDQMFEFHEIPP